MVQNPPEGSQRIVPYLLYEDAAAALAFLADAFGFEERMRLPGSEGAIMHAELALGGELVMLASTAAAANAASPKSLPAHHGMVLCYVDDVDGHFARARASGATVLSEPEDKPYGDRMYGAKDPEGHTWYFATHVRDVPKDEMMSSNG